MNAIVSSSAQVVQGSLFSESLLSSRQTKIVVIALAAIAVFIILLMTMCRSKISVADPAAPAIHPEPAVPADLLASDEGSMTEKEKKERFLRSVIGRMSIDDFAFQGSDQRGSCTQEQIEANGGICLTPNRASKERAGEEYIGIAVEPYLGAWHLRIYSGPGCIFTSDFDELMPIAIQTLADKEKMGREVYPEYNRPVRITDQLIISAVSGSLGTRLEGSRAGFIKWQIKQRPGEWESPPRIERDPRPRSDLSL